MFPWLIPTDLVRTARKLLSRVFGRRNPSRRAILCLSRLEDRTLMTAVPPQTAWYDNPAAPTVTVFNGGPGWLEVSGGSGSASVSPGAPPDGNGGSGIDPNAGSYGFSVSGSPGSVTWSGSADSLTIWATGDVGSVNVGGTVFIDAGGTVGDVSGRTVTAHAGGALGNVSATDTVLRAAGGTSVGTVQATHDVTEVTAGTSVGSVTAGGSVTSVSAGQSTGSVTAGGWIGTVHADVDINGSVTAGLWIGGAYLPGGGDWLHATWGNGVSAGRDITGDVSAGQGIVSVSAGRDVMGAVTASHGDIWMVHAGARVARPVTASRDIDSVIATDVIGRVSAASGFVFTVNATGSVSNGCRPGPTSGDGSTATRTRTGGLSTATRSSRGPGRIRGPRSGSG
jgi:hypothetical protein